MGHNTRSDFKTPSEAQWLRCPAHCNAHVLRVRSASNAQDALPLDLIWDFKTTSNINSIKYVYIIHCYLSILLRSLIEEIPSIE
jgi:hypothetical protein